MLPITTTDADKQIKAMARSLSSANSSSLESNHTNKNVSRAISMHGKDNNGTPPSVTRLKQELNNAQQDY